MAYDASDVSAGNCEWFTRERGREGESSAAANVKTVANVSRLGDVPSVERNHFLVLQFFLWVAIAGVAGLGCRRRIFGGMAQVSTCTLTVGLMAAWVVGTRRNGFGLCGDATQRGISWSRVRQGASGRWRSYFASGCFFKRPLDTCVMPPKIPRRKPRRLAHWFGSWASHESSAGHT